MQIRSWIELNLNKNFFFSFNIDKEVDKFYHFSILQMHSG